MASTATAQDFTSVNFDYIIVGGGTTGLVLAARYDTSLVIWIPAHRDKFTNVSLSEDPAVVVGVIEAGEWYPGVDGVSVPGKCSSACVPSVER